MAEPKCPSCEAVGTKYIISKVSDKQSKSGIPLFNIAHCSECGYVYGVFVKFPFTPGDFHAQPL